MLSRVAESIYWMNRYIERAENTARFLDVIQHLVLDLPDSVDNQWAALVSVTGDHEAFTQRYKNNSEQNIVRFLTFDRDNPNSIISALSQARANARSIREAISSEMWEQVNRSYLMVAEAEKTGRLADDPAGFLSHFKKACHLFAGTADATMSHNEGWHFARMGRMIERADKTSRIVDVKYFMLLPRVEYVGSPYDSLQWVALLKCVSAFEMYRKRFHEISPGRVAEFLVLDREFPRSMHYCLIKAEESLHAITGSMPTTYQNIAEQRIGRLRSELDYADVDEIVNAGLHEFLDAFQLKLNSVGDGIYETFFSVGAASLGQKEFAS